MLKEALTKLQAEMTANPKDEYVKFIGSFMMDHLRGQPEHAEKIMTEGKTIAGSLKVMEAEAQRKKSGNRAVITPDVGFSIVMKYYGIAVPEAAPTPVAVPSISTTLDDLF